MYGSQSLCPFGASHGLFTSPLSPPLEKGLNLPTTLYDRGYHQTPSQGVALLSSINPNPFFIRRGFEPLPKPLANPWQGDVIDYGQRPPSVKGFLYGSQSLCPFGASHIFYADYAKRWSALRGGGLSPFPLDAIEAFGDSAVEPLSKGRRKRGCKRPWLAPKGHRLCEPYKKTLTEGGFCPESIKPPAKDWREVWRVVRSPLLR